MTFGDHIDDIHAYGAATPRLESWNAAVYAVRRVIADMAFQQWQEMSRATCDCEQHKAEQRHAAMMACLEAIELLRA